MSVTAKRLATKGRAPVAAVLVFMLAAAGVLPVRAAPVPRRVATHHAATLNGVSFNYTAWVEDNFVNDRRGRPGASVITVAYVREHVARPDERPVVFAFNGGPGAAGAMLNFSALGPVRLIGQVRGEPVSGRFESNPDSLLDTADLVFIDPVGTGFSRAFPGEDARQWYSDTADAASVIQAIRRWLEVHHRESSPRYLIGESYGTDRAGRVLEQAKDLRFNGVTLVALAVPAEGHLIPYVTSLPTMAAGAWYHQKIDRGGRTVEQVFADAEQFARTRYLTALIQGSSLPPADRKRLAEHLSKLTGLPVSLIEKKDLRIDKNTYMFNLLKDQHQRTGLLDLRVTAPLVPNAQGAIDDPALDVLPKKLIGKPHLTPFDMGILKSAMIAKYLEHELRFPATADYYSINFIANGEWSHGHDFDTVAAVGTAMKAHPQMRLMWVQGLYDFACPAYLARYTIDQDGIPANRLTALLLAGPHSSYTAPGNLPIFTAALRKFLTPPRRVQ